MKAEIHPLTHPIKATCHCGASFALVSTIDHDLNLEVCSQCHPFYTGKKHLIDAAGRVDRYRERLAKTEVLRAAAVARAKEQAKRPPKAPAETK